MPGVAGRYSRLEASGCRRAPAARQANSSNRGRILITESPRQARVACELLVHVFFVSDRMFDGPGGHRQLHQVFELGANHAQVAVGDAVAGVLHDKADDLRVLVEIIRTGGDLHGLLPISRIAVQPGAAPSTWFTRSCTI